MIKSELRTQRSGVSGGEVRLLRYAACAARKEALHGVNNHLGGCTVVSCDIHVKIDQRPMQRRVVRLIAGHRRGETQSFAGSFAAPVRQRSSLWASTPSGSTWTRRSAATRGSTEAVSLGIVRTAPASRCHRHGSSILRRASRIRRPLLRRDRDPRQIRSSDAWPPGRANHRPQRQTRLRPYTGDAGAAHPAREGDFEYLVPVPVWSP